MKNAGNPYSMQVSFVKNVIPLVRVVSLLVGFLVLFLLQDLFFSSGRLMCDEKTKTGYPVLKNKVRCGNCNKFANKEDWNKFVMVERVGVILFDCFDSPFLSFWGS